jgi:hypothetical protein
MSPPATSRFGPDEGFTPSLSSQAAQLLHGMDQELSPGQPAPSTLRLGFDSTAAANLPAVPAPNSAHRPSPGRHR